MVSAMNDIRIYWLWLVIVFGPANPRIWRLSKHYDNAEHFVKALLDDTIEELTGKEKNRIKKIKFSDARKLLEYCNEKGINVYCYESEGYPEKLRGISNPPCVLFCYGNLDFWGDRVNIAVVGTRNPSDYSVSITEKICRELVKAKIIISTGFALGIDQVANMAVLKENATTLAVCGKSIDEDYPKDSYEMKMQIAKNGAVISEYYPTCKPLNNSFKNRNRILIGLCDGVLFCECSADSKGLDNALQATTLGKPIFVVPPCDILDKRYFGQRNLIRSGGICTFGSEDILYNLSFDNSEKLGVIKRIGEYASAYRSVLFYEDKPKKTHRKKKINKAKNVEEKKELNISYENLNPLQIKICKVLESKNLMADEIALLTGEDITDILSELIDLEIEGVVKSLAGKMYGLTD